MTTEADRKVGAHIAARHFTEASLTIAIAEALATARSETWAKATKVAAGRVSAHRPRCKPVVHKRGRVSPMECEHCRLADDVKEAMKVAATQKEGE